MTSLDELIKLAREERDHFTHEAMKHGGLHETSAFQLARAVLALLTPDKPCGWDVSDVVEVEDVEIDGKQFSPAVHIRANGNLWPDEAAWCALEILKAAEKAKEQLK